MPEARIGWLEETMASQAQQAGLTAGVELRQSGCPFAPRCLLAMPGTCDKEDPPKRHGTDGHRIECHRQIEELM